MFGLFKKNKSEKPSDYQFQDPPDTMCFSCRHVVTDGQSILHVTHDHDGSWQFLCGQEHSEEDGKILSLMNITQIDPSVNGLYEMPIGIGAERDTKDGDWSPYKLADE